jgi:uncharacterized caspase-like protein
MRRMLRAFLVLWLALAGATAAQEPVRVALVIANGAYQAVPRLDNPKRDAALVAGALKQEGFTVTALQLDLDKPRFEAALRDFKRQADAADIAMIYYAGHGIELEDQNWLLPVDASPTPPTR